MIGIAVLGAGRIGKIHAASVAANPKAKLVAIADPFPEAVEPVARSLGTEAMVDPMAAIARPDVDAVVIGTPTDTHVGFLLKAVGLGKAVFCEKPIDLSLERAREIVAYAEVRGAKVMVNFNRRFDPDHAELKRIVDSDGIGTVELVQLTARGPAVPALEYVKVSGGQMRDQTVHFFDLARWIAGPDRAAAKRVFDAMMQMRKIDVAAIEAARRG